MLRKGNEVKWTVEPRGSFDQIKRALTEAPVLISPDYSKDFLIFSFASFDTMAVVLLQKNIEGLEQPISFFSQALRDAEIKYDIMEKQAYALVKSLKAFKVYVLHSKAMFHQDSETTGRGCGGTHKRGCGGTHKGDVWEYPQILGIFGKWRTGGRHIYNIKNIKNKILKIKIIIINLNNNIN
jgi:hypothetical protein